MGLNPNQHQGLFGESFVRVLASAAGLIVARPELGVTGDDFTISHKGVDFALPRFLVLVVVPDDWVDYATVSPESGHLKYAAYWQSLRDGERVTGDPESKVPVLVPHANLLTVDALRAIRRVTRSLRPGSSSSSVLAGSATMRTYAR